DGAMTLSHSGDAPPYAPNSFGGPQADPARGADLGWAVEAGELARVAQVRRRDDDDFGQAGSLVRDVIGDAERATLVENIVGHASAPEVSAPMKQRVFEYWSNVDAGVGASVAAGLGVAGGAPSGNGAIADVVR